MSRSAEVRPYGEEALLVDIGGEPGEEASARIRALAHLVERLRDEQPAIGPTVPAYTTLLVPFDADVLDPPGLQQRLERLADEAVGAPDRSAPPALAVEVSYGGREGPDLVTVARRIGRSANEVVALHTGTTYRVHFLGFAPGFAYLGPLPEALRLPRRDEPRVRVPAGSVAIAAAQTAVYPFSTPGGWHLIGRTEATFWDVAEDPPARLRPGDRVRFVGV